MVSYEKRVNIFSLNPLLKFLSPLFVFLFTYLNCFSQNGAQSTCSGFQLAIGTSAFERAYDVAPALNNDFFTVGITNATGNDDILVSKSDVNGIVLWSKTFGGANTESVRKISPTSDGGVLIVGQTKSFDNPNGEILCLKINNSGTLVWSKKFGIGSTFGDLGMDIIETTDGGYAISGILNVNGGVADAVVIKIDNSANVQWSKRFDHFDGDDGVGLVQKGDTLIVASDIQNSAGDYTMSLTKLKLTDGSFIMARKLSPGARGIFNPYLYKNPVQPGYIISVHTIDNTSYANMKHTIITVNENFDIINSKLISVNPVTNDFFTGIVPLSDGSIIGCASPQTNADGYIYRINSNNSVAYSKRFNATTDKRLYRLTSLGQNIVAVGGIVLNNQEDFFLTEFNSDGTLGPDCTLEDVQISVEQPSYSSTSFTWPSITDVTFNNTLITLSSNNPTLTKTDLCPLCDSIKITGPDKVCSKEDTITYSIYKSPNCTQQYSLIVDNNYADIISQSPTSLKLKFKQDGLTTIKVAFDNPCKLVVDSLNVNAKFSPRELNLGPDKSVCKDTSLILHAGNGFDTYAWQNGSNDSNLVVTTAGTYSVIAENLCGIKFKDTFQLVRNIPKPFNASPISATVCKGDTVQFNATGGTAYQWEPALNFDHSDSSSPRGIINSTENLSVHISDAICFRDTLIVIPVTASASANIKILKSNDVTCSNDSAVLIGNGGVSYNWYPNAYINRINNSQVTVRPPQTFTYYVVGKDENGCTGKDSIIVFFKKEGEQKLYMPSAFTPNGDGLNDLFRPVFTGPSSNYSFRIYNRWGQLIFETNTPGRGWDGTFKAKPQPKDVYIYYLNAEGGCNGKFEQKGTFVLIK